MPAHKHAELMAQYAQDAAETDKPWERWEIRDYISHDWVSINGAFYFQKVRSYRRKPQKKAVDLSVLISSGIDCELSLNNAFCSAYLGTLDGTHSEDGKTKYRYKGDSYPYCRPRMNHWHNWQGGECPLPEGLTIEWIVRSGIIIDDMSVMDADWTYEDGNGDIIAFKVTGLAEGYCWPWELNNG